MFRINAKLVRDFLFQRGLSVREFAAAAGLNALTAGKLIRDGATATMKTISALAKFFGVDGNSLILGGEAHD